jgi:hypothetical protein
LTDANINTLLSAIDGVSESISTISTDNITKINAFKKIKVEFD